MAFGIAKKNIPQIARVVLGIIFAISGINYVFGFFHINYTTEGQSFIDSLKASGYVWPLLKITELVCGLMLIFGYFGPLALFVLAPITMAIIFFHVFLSPGQGAILGYIAFALEIFLILYWRKYFLHIFRDFFDDVDKRKIVQEQ